MSASSEKELANSLEKAQKYVSPYNTVNKVFISPINKKYTFDSAKDFFTTAGEETLEILRENGKDFIEEIKHDSVEYQQFIRSKEMFEQAFGVESFISETFNKKHLEADARNMIAKELLSAKSAFNDIFSRKKQKQRMPNAFKNLAIVEGVSNTIKYIPNGQERLLYTYYNSSSVVMANGEDEPLPPLITGLKEFKTEFVNALNANLENYNASVPKANTSRPSFLDDSENKILFQLDKHIPDMIVTQLKATDGNAVLEYTTPYKALGYESFEDFLLADASTKQETAAKITEKIEKNTMDPPFANENSMKFYNTSIEALAKSMPDFAPNMFDVLIGVYKKNPRNFFYNITPPPETDEDIPFIEDNDIYSIPDNYPNIYKKFVNYYNFMIRVASISVPQATAQVETISFLNKKIPITVAKSSMKNQSTLSFRADQALFFTDEIQRLSGNFIYKIVGSNIKAEATSSSEGSTVQQVNSSVKSALHSTFYMPYGPAYNLSADNQNKINIYVPMYDSSLDTMYRSNSLYDYPIAKGYYAKTKKLVKIPVYCFEDVRFLGNNDIGLNSQSAGVITITVDFIYRRLYKFYTDQF